MNTHSTEVVALSPVTAQEISREPARSIGEGIRSARDKSWLAGLAYLRHGPALHIFRRGQPVAIDPVSNQRLLALNG